MEKRIGEKVFSREFSQESKNKVYKVLDDTVSRNKRKKYNRRNSGQTDRLVIESSSEVIVKELKPRYFDPNKIKDPVTRAHVEMALSAIFLTFTDGQYRTFMKEILQLTQWVGTKMLDSLYRAFYLGEKKVLKTTKFYRRKHNDLFRDLYFFLDYELSSKTNILSILQNLNLDSDSSEYEAVTIFLVKYKNLLIEEYKSQII